MSFILCFFAFLKKKVMYTFGEQKEKRMMTFISKQGNVCIYVKCWRDELMERSLIFINALSFFFTLLILSSSIVASKNDRK